MQAIRCDRCGKFARIGFDYLSKTARWYNDRHDSEYPFSFDLCRTCADELAEWLTTLHEETST